MSAKSKYEEFVTGYNPDRDGTMKAYCDRLGLNYNTFKKTAYLLRRKAGHIPKAQQDYSAFCKELQLSGEPIKTFCQRNNLNYDNFRVSWYHYRKRHGLTIKKRSKKNPNASSDQSQS